MFSFVIKMTQFRHLELHSIHQYLYNDLSLCVSVRFKVEEKKGHTDCPCVNFVLAFTVVFN